MDPEKVILNLLKQTQEGKIEWAITSPEPQFRYLYLSTNDSVETVYTAQINGQRLALYEERYRHYTDEDVFYWSARICLDVVNEEGTRLWSFPASVYLIDLLKAAAYRAADVAQILKDLMNDS